MKTKYYSNTLRLKVIREKGFGDSVSLVLKIQEKKWLFWKTVDWLSIEVQNYWGYIPGDKRFGGPMHLDCGSKKMEVWPPDILDLEKRSREFMTEYFNANKGRLMSERIVKKQLESI